VGAANQPASCFGSGGADFKGHGALAAAERVSVVV